MSLEAILEQVTRYGAPLVEVTGGEPLAQSSACGLLARLCHEGFEVLLETSGAIDISLVDDRVTIIMDIKCPGSDMQTRMCWDNLQHLTPTDQIKFVISDRRDYDWAVEMVMHYHLMDRCPVLFSPVFGEQALQPMAEWILQDRLPVRFQVQLHKYIWDPDTRGV